MDSVVVLIWKAGLRFLSSLLAAVIMESSKDGSEERCLKLSTDHGDGATCVPASVNE